MPTSRWRLLVWAFSSAESPHCAGILATPLLAAKKTGQVYPATPSCALLLLPLADANPALLRLLKKLIPYYTP